MSERTWRIDPEVAADLAAALGWSPEHGVAALAARLPERVPAGSTAKLDAVARGEVPPGADPEALARRLLEAQRSWADPPAGGVPSPSWSCWVFTTVMAALVDWADLGPVQVAAVRRIDERAPVVDFHAAVVVGEGATPLICDPYFGTAVELPAEPGTANVNRAGGATATAHRGADGAWYLDAHLARWEQGCTYRVVAPALDRGDVAAFCAVSTTHSGVPMRGYARLHRPGQVFDLVEREDGAGATAGSWTQHHGEEAVQVAVARPTWSEAVDVFAGWTGVRIT